MGMTNSIKPRIVDKSNLRPGCDPGVQAIEDANVRNMVKNILASFDKHYPGYKDHWNIRVDTGGGIIQVRNSLISGKMGFQCPLAWLDPGDKVVIGLAGELLERYNLSRAKNIDVTDELLNLERDVTGEAKYEQ
jgi:hypothetical protein